jgi:D-alanyl-D-alanine-carboxypeptidase/D-alanyl-D-alanine-endopeptidase
MQTLDGIGARTARRNTGMVSLVGNGLKVVALCLSAAIAAGSLEAADRKTAIDKIAGPFIETRKAAAIVVGVEEGGAATFYGYGKVRNEEKATPNEKTVFEIGSVTKVFTALLLADMVQRGMASLDDPVRKYLPPGTVPETQGGAAEIRLIDLVTHTSGLPRLPNNLDVQDWSNPYADYTPAKLYEFLAKYGLMRYADTKYSYSNLGMGLLGHLLARRAGTSYEQLVIDRIANPLDLRDTRITLSEEQKSRLAPGHYASGAPAKNWDLGVLEGAGALRSTAADLLRFVAANLDPPPALSAAIAMTHKIHAETGQPPGSIALAWHVLPDGKTYWHNGATGGYSAHVSFNTERKTAVVVLVSTSGKVMDEIGFAVQKALAE